MPRAGNGLCLCAELWKMFLRPRQSQVLNFIKKQANSVSNDLPCKLVVKGDDLNFCFFEHHKDAS